MLDWEVEHGTDNDYMRRIKWPDGVIACPECGSDRIDGKAQLMGECERCKDREETHG